MINIVEAKNMYGRYCVPRTSAKTSPPAKKILAGDIYEPKTIEYIRMNCGDGDIIHAGAYFGDFIPGIADKCLGMVWAFEPKYEHFYCSELTVKMNDLDNVVMTHAGVGDHNISRMLQIIAEDGRTWGGGSRITGNTDVKLNEQIRLVRIDDIVPRENKVSIIHLDVEGFETFALKGAMETIKAHLPKLIIETMPSTNWMKKNIYSLGYSIKQKIHHNTLLTV